MNELLCGNGRYNIRSYPECDRERNSNSSLCAKHYPETWARVKPEADDAGYALNQQSEQLSDQVPTEASTNRLHNLAELEIADQFTHCRITPELSRPAAGRRLGANIAEGVQLGAATMWVRLE